MASGTGIKEIVEALEKGRKLQRGAWLRVTEAARKYALLKAQGVEIDRNGCRISFSHRDAQDRMKYAGEELLRAAEEAFAEDALMGATLSNHLG